MIYPNTRKMKLIISSVESAYVEVLDIKEKRQIWKWLLVYICISQEDENLEKQKLDKKIDKVVERLSKLQIIEKNWKISTSIDKENLEILLIPNFTVCWENKKWNKIDFNNAWSFWFSKNIFKQITNKLLENNIKVKTWEFGASMKVWSVNLWPLNYVLEF